MPYSAHFDDGKWEVKPGKGGYAWSMLKPEQTVHGWNILQVVSNKDVSNQLQAYAAGFVEGAITQPLIWDSFRNFANGTVYQVNPKVLDFVQKNIEWLHSQCSNPPPQEQVYWEQVSLLLVQFDAVIDGYNQYAPSDQKINATQMILYNLEDELGDISRSVGVQVDPSLDRSLHCSVLIKKISNSELYASHNTWTRFSDMLRIFKHYTLYYNTSSSHTVSFSSFPGVLMSGDDYYLASTGLVVMETTNDVFNSSLFAAVQPTTTPYWIRVMVANRVAQQGSEWAHLFGKYNSGTYNNQWMVINANYKNFTGLEKGLFYVVEQVPGIMVGADQTKHLLDASYWPSYNIPFYPEIYDISGYPTMFKKYGNEYSHSNCSRANIFRRDQHNVDDLSSMKKVMRYNEWQTDPLSLKDACKGISARCDLNPPWVENSLNGWVAFGAIDAKLVLIPQGAKEMKTYAVAGPSWDSQLPFAWTNEWKYEPHFGHVEFFNFDWVEMSPEQ